MAALPKAELVAYLVRLGDDHLILGHRLSELCGHAPILEEDLALPNMALDLIGGARVLYGYAGEIEGKGRDEDDFAYRRVEMDYRHLLLVERPNGDFARTMMRQFLFAAFMHPFWELVQGSADGMLAAHAGKAVKEVAYHVRHSGEWLIRLGDGTAESAMRTSQAVTYLAPYIEEMFEVDTVYQTLASAGILPDIDVIRARFDATLADTFAMANLVRPSDIFNLSGGRIGHHSEALGHLLTTLQFMQKTYPGITW